MVPRPKEGKLKGSPSIHQSKNKEEKGSKQLTGGRESLREKGTSLLSFKRLGGACTREYVSFLQSPISFVITNKRKKKGENRMK